MNLDALPCGVVEFDDSLCITYANAEAARLLGRSTEALLSVRVPTLLDPAGRIFFQTHINPVLALRGTMDEIYLRLRPPEGEEVPVIMSATRTDRSGQTRYLLTFSPMRRRQAYEQELVDARDAAETSARLEREATAQVREAHAQLALNERLASLGTLAHGIAHEINNPLTYVDGNLCLIAEILRRDAPIDRAEMLELATEALEGAERIREITKQMGQLARADELPRVRLDPRALLPLVSRMTTAQTKARSRVELVLDDVPYVDADAGRLGQVLINLVVNAAQAVAHRARDQNLIRLTTRTTATGDALIEVLDNGPGIPDEIASRVFEPFFTTKPVGEGTGLGLSISRGIVESLGGTLTFDTPASGGTRFVITLPPSTLPADPPLGAQAAQADPGVARRRILIVDDDVAVVRSLARLLRRFDVTTATSATEALDLVRQGPPFALVLTDLRMPRRDGLWLYRAIVEHDDQMASRIAFVTGGVSPTLRDEVESLEVPILLKPLDVPGLLTFCEERIASTKNPTPAQS